MLWKWKKKYTSLLKDHTDLLNKWGHVTLTLDLPEDASTGAALQAIAKLRRDMKCEHSHTFKMDVPEGTHWYSYGNDKGPHPGGLQVVGCYVCGAVWCRNYRE